MSDERLKELFAADVPQAADRAFAFAVLERLERRRAWNEIMDFVPLAIAAAALLWLLAPTIDHVMQTGVAVLNAPNFFMTVVLLLSAYLLFWRDQFTAQ